VEAAARGLHAAGLGWEGSRLAGQAAIRTTDRKEMSALLALARGLHSDAPSVGSGADGSTASGGVLSEREREIATLLLAGLTYKQIGERLFISAKTVEHHVARIRQRLGSAGRAELLAQLRSMVEEPGA
jgi:DNA-binding CsgD family transcriptional regulator